MHEGQRRLSYLDGLRGVAAVSVVLFHWFGEIYKNFTPYGDRYAAYPLVREGWMGVEMFFLISGFVIFMTIERCTGFADFMLRRWLRLFPAMLICSVFLVALFTAVSLPGEASTVRPRDIIPGIVFVDPIVINSVLGVRLSSLDNTFWTLYVEMVFYLVFGFLYFTWGWKRAVFALVAMFLAVRLYRLMLPELSLPYVLVRAVEPFEWIGIQYFGWFASGALFYKAYQTGRNVLFWMAVSTGLLSVALFTLSVGMTPRTYVGLALVVVTFAAVQRSAMLRTIISWRPLLLLGFVSYPLYLIHNKLGIGLIAVFAPSLSWLPDVSAAVAAASLVIPLAWLIARYAEPALMGKLRQFATSLTAARNAGGDVSQASAPSKLP